MNLPTHKDTMSSREIARITGKPHNDVMKAIREWKMLGKKLTEENFPWLNIKT